MRCTSHTKLVILYGAPSRIYCSTEMHVSDLLIGHWKDGHWVRHCDLPGPDVRSAHVCELSLALDYSSHQA
jgi:hypothetical protein